ncbi:MAG: WD40 repeat domain-containing serine/threonine protein kinase [Planctomycetota bacterium]
MNPPTFVSEPVANGSCPSRDYWRRFLAGEVPPAEFEAIDRHLESCDICRIALDKLSSDDWLDPVLHEHFSRENWLAQPMSIPGLLFQELIGEGGMGMVYAAVDQLTGERVACKIMSRMRPTEEDRSRFRQEATAVAALDHPNIVRLLRSGEVDGTPFFVMEFVANGSLEQRLHAQPLPPRDAARFLTKLVRAVAHAHERGVIHRDLKPGNILLGQPRKMLGDLAAPVAPVANKTEPWIDWPPKIVDFGLAKLQADATRWTRSGQILGTPAYAAPEQLAGQRTPIDPRCDVYALGAILYQLLTGVPPLQADDLLRTVRLVREADPTPPRHLQPSIPRELEIICLRCLEKTPAARYESAAALADDLDRFLERKPIRARRPSLVTRTARWARRNPWKAASMTLAALVLVGLVTAPAATALHYREVERLKSLEAATSEQGRRLAEKNLQESWLGRARHFMDQGDDIEALRYLTTVLKNAEVPPPQALWRADSILRELPRPALRVRLPIGHMPATLGPPRGSVRIHASPDGGKLLVQRIEPPAAWEVDVATAHIRTLDSTRGPYTDDQQWRLSASSAPDASSTPGKPSTSGNPSTPCKFGLSPVSGSDASIELQQPAEPPKRWLRLWRSADGKLAAALGEMESAATSGSDQPTPAAAAAADVDVVVDANAVLDFRFAWHIWKLPEGRLLREEPYKVRSAAGDIDFHCDPLAIITPHDARFIAVGDGRVVFHEDHIQRIHADVAPNRVMVAAADGFNVSFATNEQSASDAMARQIREVPLPCSLQFSRTIPVLAVGGMDGKLKLIDFHDVNRRRMSSLAVRGAIRGLRFNSLGRRVLVADEQGNVSIVEITSGDPVIPWIPHRRPLLDLAWTHQDDFAVLDDQGLLTLWRWRNEPRLANSKVGTAAGGEELEAARTTAMRAPPSPPTASATPTQAEVARTKMRLDGGPLLKQFSTDGQRLLLVQGQFAEIWDVASQRLSKRFDLPPSARMIAAPATRTRPFALSLAVGPKLDPPSMLGTPDGELVESWRLLLLDESQEKPHVGEFSLRRDAPMLLTAAPTASQWLIGTTNGAELRSENGLKSETLLAAAAPVAAAFAPSGEELSVLTRDGQLTVWALKERRRLAGWNVSGRAGGWVGNHAEPGVQVAYSPDGKQVFVYGRLGLRAWSRTDGKRLLLPDVLGQWVNHLAFDSTGQRVVTVSDVAIVQVWDTRASGKAGQWQPMSQQMRSSGHIISARFGPDDNHLILRKSSVATVARHELYRLPPLPGSDWMEREQLQVWNWETEDVVTSRYAMRDFAGDWLCDDGRQQFAGISLRNTLSWPRIEAPRLPPLETLQWLVRQYHHTTGELGEPRNLETSELISQWRTLRDQGW